MRPVRVPVKPELLLWARERAGLSRQELTRRRQALKRLLEWERGEKSPTPNQLQEFAKAVHIPVGYLYLSKPPQEELPIPDFRTNFRTVSGVRIKRPTPDLLDTLYACQERQAWYRDYARQAWNQDLDFVGRATINSSVLEVSQEMRQRIGFIPHKEPWGVARAFSKFVRVAESTGILVMVNGVVQNNTYRRLDPEEFRGFALSDPLAPLIFVNGADAKVAQMFTLAHEIAHLWLGKSAVSNFGDWQIDQGNARQEEIWCNRVAAEYLVPRETLESQFDRLSQQGHGSLLEVLPQLHRTFKVSGKAILIRLLDFGLIHREAFEQTWRETDRRPEDPQGDRGTESRSGDFHILVRSRVGRRFSEALIASTLEGRTLYRDACQMLGFSNSETFSKFAKKFM